MDGRFKEKIKRTVRRLSWSWKPYVIIKDSAKVDKATFECWKCSKFVYTGKSEKTLESLVQKYTEKTVEMGTIYIDHIDPVEDVTTGFVDWNTYMKRLFCDVSNLQPLCFSCHDAKSQIENEQRRESKKTEGKKNPPKKK